MRILALAALAALAWANAGCFDLDQEVTLNPDGSGKVVLRSIFSPVSFELTEKTPSPEKTMMKAVREELEKSEGVDAWKDVTAVLRDDGKIELRATAYFRDFSQLKLHNQGQSGSPTALSLSKNEAGDWVLSAGPDRKSAEKPAPAQKPSEAEIQERIKAERAKYQQAKPLMESFLKDSRTRTRVNLPGTLSESSNFKKLSASSVEIAVEGKALLKVLDDFILDDAFMRKVAESGRGINDSDSLDAEILAQKLFGTKGPIRAVAKGPFKAAFDYEKEAAPARKETPGILAKFGAPPPPTAIDPAKGGGLKSVQVAGIQFVHFRDHERELGPMNAQDAGVTLTLVAELPGAVLSVKEGKVSKALSDTGEDLLPKSDFSRTVHFPRLSKDKAAVTFDVPLRLPSPKARGFKEISGLLTYVVAGKSREVDLGIGLFQSGAKGKELGARIEKIEDHPFDKAKKSLSLKIEAPQDSIQSVTFYDESGKKLAVDSGGWSGFDNQVTYSYTFKGDPPARGRIVALVYEDRKSFEVPFRVADLDLLGRPQN
jgi:hypothetical protein